jgi:hypothetical protein
MDHNLAVLVTLLAAMGGFLVMFAYTVNGVAQTVDALGNLSSAVERFVTRFRRMVQAFRRRRH